MRSAEEFVKASNTTYPKALLVAMIAARDAEWQAQVDAEQKAHEEIAQICFKAGAATGDGTSVSAVRNLAARVDRLTAALRYLFDSGPTPEGFGNLEKDCYEYAIDLMRPEEDQLADGDPRWFEGWLRMIEESAKRAALEGGQG